MKKYKRTLTIWYFPNYGNYKKYKLHDSDTYENYGVFYFLTNSGEVGVLNCISPISIGEKSVSEIYDEVIKEYNIEEYMINSVRQDAWRYFADKSVNGDIWHMDYMSGTPFKNGLTEEEIYSVKFVKEEELEPIEAQEITFNKWLSLSKIR